MRHPAAFFTSVWFMRNSDSEAGWPGSPMLNIIGTKSCAVASLNKTTLRPDMSGESFQVPWCRASNRFNAASRPQIGTPRETHRNVGESTKRSRTAAMSWAFCARTKRSNVALTSSSEPANDGRAKNASAAQAITRKLFISVPLLLVRRCRRACPHGRSAPGQMAPNDRVPRADDFTRSNAR